MKKNIALLPMFILSVIYSGDVFTQDTNEKMGTKFIRVEEQITKSAASNLISGSAYIEFPQKLSESINNKKYSVQLTAQNSWSGLFVIDATSKGFFVKSEQGDLNASFFWSITTLIEPQGKKE